MLAGVKFIPRDQLNLAPGTSNSDSDSDVEERKSSRNRKGKHDRRIKKKHQHESSDDDEGTERTKRRSRRRKKKSKRQCSSDETNSASSESGSESLSDHGKEKDRKRMRSTKRRRRDSSSEVSYSSDEYEKAERWKEGRSKHGKEKSSKREKGKITDEKDFSEDDKEILLNNARKELGLEWMLKSGNKMDNNSAQIEADLEESQVEEVNRTNPREMNPYLKDNGSGYPVDASVSEVGVNQLRPSSVVGDGGASWRLKALKRAKEQAVREGRKLDDVVEERWGSLGQLAVSVAARRAAPAHAHLHAIKDRKRGITEKPETAARGEMKGHTEEVKRGSREYLRDLSSRHPEMRKPKHDSLTWKKMKGQNIPSEDTALISEVVSGLNKFANDGSFMGDINHRQTKDAGVSNSSPHVNIEANDHKQAEFVSSKANDSTEGCSVKKQALSVNQLAAKALQLRMKGKHEEAEKLSKEMEAMIDRQGTSTEAIRQEIGGSTGGYIGKQVSKERKKREEDADLHLAQKIMQNKQYSISGRADDEYDFDDAPRRKHNRKREGVSEEKKLMPKRILTQQERCQFCFENPSRPKHLVVSIANFTYMMLPQSQPVVQGHCCILPMQHESATRTVDNNVWEEIRNFKKCLLMMFAKQDKDVVFLETVIGLAQQRRHCLVECIPLPSELAKEAPMYFKKAIDEAEDEWSQHNAKKLIDTSRGLRHVIPPNFPYFHVEFGLDRGFAHVIDDESNFNSSLGLNVIRGMLRLPEEDMYRRRRHEPMDKQKQAAASFVQDWEPFDWTKQLD